MFAKTIIDSDAFLDMPLTTQALYFHLSMRADDEGFINNPKKIMRMIGASEDELRLLIAKSFIIPFESGVCVIKHWRIHNYLRSDRFKPTTYIDERAQLSVKENSAYSLIPVNENLGIPDGIPVGIPNVHQCETQDRLGKDSIGKYSIDKDREEDPADEPPALPAHSESSKTIPYDEVQNLYNSICKSFPKCTVMSNNRKRAIKARFNSGYNLGHFKILFEKAEASSFMKGKNDRGWRATFDWMIADSGMAKVLDGNYDDHRGQTVQPAQRNSGATFMDMLREEEAARWNE